MDNRFYSYIGDALKVDAFNVLDYFSVNRKAFDGLNYYDAFRKLYDECSFLGLSEFALSRAVDTVLTLEQRRMNSYSGGNTHIEDYTPGQVKDWQEYLK